MGTVIITGTIKMLSLSVQSSQVVRSSLSEQELRAAVNNILVNDLSCKENLKPKTGARGFLTGADKNKGVGAVNRLQFYSPPVPPATTPAGRILIDQARAFKGDLDIVKMSLSGDKTKLPTSGAVDRTFVVHYKKKGLGQLNTVGGGVCSPSDTSGCYYVSCDLRYELDNSDSSHVVVSLCEAQNCTAYTTVAAGAPKCYKAEGEKTVKKRTLVGCGSTQDNTGPNTTALGFDAGKAGGNNVFIGFGAGKNNQAKDNVFIGFKAGAKNTKDDTATPKKPEARYNTFVGSQAGMANTTGWDNTLIGADAGDDITTSLRNTIIGAHAGGGMSSGHGHNTFLGTYAGSKTTSGHSNTFLGEDAGAHNKTGSRNTFVGANAGTGGDVGSDNTCILSSCNITGSHNTALGYGPGMSLTSGEDNIFIGRKAGYSTTTGDDNIFIGRKAGYLHTTGGSNVFIGARTGYSSTTAYNNVFIGWEAGHKNLFDKAGTINLHEASFNVFVGKAAGYTNSYGFANTFIGNHAGYATTTGYRNIFIGHGTGSANITGQQNVYVGVEAGHKSTGSYNTFLGDDAGFSQTGNNNIIIKAGGYLVRRTPMTTNRFLGAQNDSPGSRNILIGSFSRKKEKELMSQNSHYLWIQDLIEGNAKEKWVAVNSQVETKNLYASLHTSSDKRLKTNLTPLSNALEKINQLKSYSFNWKDEADAVIPPTPPTPLFLSTSGEKKGKSPIVSKGEGGLKEAARGGGDTTPPAPLSLQGGKGGVKAGGRHFGFVAQEALEVLPEVVEKNRKGFFTIRYTEIIPLLVSAFKEFQNKILTAVEQLKTSLFQTHVRLNEMEHKIKNLEKENQQLKTEIAVLRKNHIKQ